MQCVILKCSLIEANNLRNAIARNPELSKKYDVSGTGNEIKLTQKAGHESAVLPKIMLSNAGDGDVFKSKFANWTKSTSNHDC